MCRPTSRREEAKRMAASGSDSAQWQKRGIGRLLATGLALAVSAALSAAYKGFFGEAGKSAWQRFEEEVGLAVEPLKAAPEGSSAPAPSPSPPAAKGEPRSPTT